MTATMEEDHPIRVGDVVEHRFLSDLEPRTVTEVGPDWLTLKFPNGYSPRLPLDEYRTIKRAEEA